MDRQKQIEEMAKVLDGDCGECYTCKYFEHKGTNCTYLLGAEYLYNAGYRKIPENAVVLTNKKLELGEYKGEVQVMAMTRRVYDAILAQARKETAEKFARLVEFHSVSTRDEKGKEIFTISALCLKEILHEEFGIPYDEICKEITESKE